jgi:hypothetical protein
VATSVGTVPAGQRAAFLICAALSLVLPKTAVADDHS